jgi:DNA polymerase-3 subunit epsilon
VNNNVKKYVSVDIENPNSRNNSICAIGIVVVENGEIVDKKYSLIDPEDRFDSQTIGINGIEPSMVVGKPTFKEYWNEVKDLLINNIIVGHNIQYDLSVISKSLQRYDIETPVFSYYCTLDLSRKHLTCDSYKLDVLANKLGIIFNHHNALEDADTSRQIFEYIDRNYSVEIKELKKYYYEDKTIDNLDSKLESNINELYGIIQAINYDKIINDKEIAKIKNWVEENRIYKQYTLFNRIIISLDKILEDNVITPYEKIELFKLVNSIHNSKLYSETTLALQILEGIISGISCDNVINIEEITMLKQWLEINNYLADVYPYDKALLIVNEVLKDGILAEEEKQYLADAFKGILNPITLGSNNSLDFGGKTFCLTGEFKTGTKDEIKSKIAAKGGIEKSGVSSKLDYLFVGEMGSDAWKFGKIGGKIAKAQELIEQGSNVKIIGESDLITCL